MGSHAVLCEASDQHQQQDRAAPVSSCSKATRQREIDGLCSQMRSASLHFVCVSVSVCDFQDGGMDVEKGNEEERERGKQRPGEPALLLLSLHN